MDTPQPIVYMFHNPETDQAYFGSTEYPLRRKWTHLSTLKKGQHRNPAFQNDFNDNSNFEYVTLKVDTMDEARELEKMLIISHVGDPGLLNVHHNPDGHISLTDGHTKRDGARERRLRVIEERGLRQGIMVDGVPYSSLSEAAILLGVPVGTVRSRIMSPNFQNWQYS
jgi:hypothetical protein